MFMHLQRSIVWGVGEVWWGGMYLSQPFARLAMAGYAGLIAMLPEASWRHFTFMGGAGIGLAARRNWKHHVDPHHTSSTFQDWGTLEGMWGLYGELDFLFHNEARTREFVVSLIPGFPHILAFSVGMRWRIGGRH